MKTYILVILSMLMLQSVSAQESTADDTISTYYLIRHAEKDRSDKSNKNPNLTEAGKQRSENWSKVFKNVSFDMIYSTDYNRTKQTAQPTADAKGLDISLYNPQTMDLEAFMKITKGKTVLVVGHSNTTPMFANGLLNESTYEMIADDNNANLYIVTVTENSKSSSLLVMD
ncbi:MAG: phosphoglycerate mutase family protein [Bacteroidota bacterium]